METSTDTEVTLTEDETQQALDKLIRNHVWGSIGIGLVPIPIVDMVALTAIQINLVRKIAKSYDVPFSQDKVKNILASLVGSAIPSVAGAPLAASLIKTVPIIGWTTGAITMPVLSGAATYAVGKVFIRHFSSGGTFLTLDPEKVKDYYAEMFKEGQTVAKEGDALATDVKQNTDTKSGIDKKNMNQKKSK